MEPYVVNVVNQWNSAGVVVQDGVVIKAAPILKWTIGMNLLQLEAYALARAAHLCFVPPSVAEKTVKDIALGE